jgi:hypothetical protein
MFGSYRPVGYYRENAPRNGAVNSCQYLMKPFARLYRHARSEIVELG